eukprot:NODE_642_length_2022_cov_45.579321_g593_i0.p1 GENE.NODE_642_length_2022_cov_45.579321_g593_i0~~NODE_642_length_2022_cov_45.579321_g593_i0.p1  ORF type:complete len:591 (+),score=76.21 NODE_642_length_2022_cov_45.579321_g593_i0:124-1896(+)
MPQLPWAKRPAPFALIATAGEEHQPASSAASVGDGGRVSLSPLRAGPSSQRWIKKPSQRTDVLRGHCYAFHPALAAEAILRSGPIPRCDTPIRSSTAADAGPTAHWWVVESRVGDPGAVSLQSASTGGFLRNVGCALETSVDDGSFAFKSDASFLIVAARNGDPRGVSFESSSCPHYYLTFRRAGGGASTDGVLRLSHDNATKTFQRAASWMPEEIERDYLEDLPAMLQSPPAAALLRRNDDNVRLVASPRGRKQPRDLLDGENTELDHTRDGDKEEIPLAAERSRSRPRTGALTRRVDQVPSSPKLGQNSPHAMAAQAGACAGADAAAGATDDAARHQTRCDGDASNPESLVSKMEEVSAAQPNATGKWEVTDGMLPAPQHSSPSAYSYRTYPLGHPVPLLPTSGRSDNFLAARGRHLHQYRPMVIDEPSREPYRSCSVGRSSLEIERIIPEPSRRFSLNDAPCHFGLLPMTTQSGEVLLGSDYPAEQPLPRRRFYYNTYFEPATIEEEDINGAAGAPSGAGESSLHDAPEYCFHPSSSLSYRSSPTRWLGTAAPALLPDELPSHPDCLRCNVTRRRAGRMPAHTLHHY